MSRNFVYSDAPDASQHWDNCIASRKPYIVVTQEKGGKYCKVDYDILPCSILPFDFDNKLSDEFSRIYQSYCSFFSMPAKYQSISGGACFNSFRILKDHSEVLVDKLKDFLESFLNPFLQNHLTQYEKVIAEVFSNTVTLREVFDFHSAEYQKTLVQKKIGILKKIVVSKYDLKLVADGYCEYYKSEKPHIIGSNYAGIKATYLSLAAIHSSEDDVFFGPHSAPPLHHYILLLENKVKEMIA